MTPIAARDRQDIGRRQAEQQCLDEAARGHRDRQPGDDADDDQDHRLAHHQAQARRRAARRAPCGCRSRWCGARRCRTSGRTGRSTPAAAPARRTACRPARTPSPAGTAARPARSASTRPSSAGSDRSAAPPRGSPPVTLAGSPAVRTSNTALPNRVCGYGTYIVGGAGSRTLLYFASRSDADDLELAGRLEAGAEALADRILVREVLPRRRLVDDDDLRRRRRCRDR